MKINITYAGDSIIEEAGNVYVYYIPDTACSKCSFTYQTVSAEENKRYNVNISIYQKDGGYFAHLNAITESEE